MYCCVPWLCKHEYPGSLNVSELQEEPCTEQLYVLCDISIATVKSLADQMGLDWAAVSGQYPGSITLPKGLYRPLDKDERGEWI